jgi:hypothetical protein
MTDSEEHRKKYKDALFKGLTDTVDTFTESCEDAFPDKGTLCNLIIDTLYSVTATYLLFIMREFDVSPEEMCINVSDYQRQIIEGIEQSVKAEVRDE